MDIHRLNRMMNIRLSMMAINAQQPSMCAAQSRSCRSDSLQKHCCGVVVEWTPRLWSSGDQELPSRLVLASPEEMAQLLGHGKIWRRAGERYAAWCTQYPRLAGSRAMSRNCDDVLVGYGDADFVRLTALLQWLVDNPNSGLYLRQLPLEDVGGSGRAAVSFRI